jgi:hypothetical protein
MSIRIKILTDHGQALYFGDYATVSSAIQAISIVENFHTFRDRMFVEHKLSTLEQTVTPEAERIQLYPL